MADRATIISYDADQRQSAVGSAGAEQLQLHRRRQLASRADTVNSTTYTTTYGYDNGGRLSSLADPLTGSTLAYT